MRRLVHDRTVPGRVQIAFIGSWVSHFSNTRGRVDDRVEKLLPREMRAGGILTAVKVIEGWNQLMWDEPITEKDTKE